MQNNEITRTHNELGLFMYQANTYCTKEVTLLSHFIRIFPEITSEWETGQAQLWFKENNRLQSRQKHGKSHLPLALFFTCERLCINAPYGVIICSLPWGFKRDWESERQKDFFYRNNLFTVRPEILKRYSWFKLSSVKNMFINTFVYFEL